MAVALIIGLWVYDQYSYDKFLPDYKQYTRCIAIFIVMAIHLLMQTTSLKLADALRNQIPEIEYVAETDGGGMHGLMVADKKLYTKWAIRLAADFLKMFQYALLEGNANTVLKNPYSIVLTQSTAKALFGNEDAVK